MGNSHLHNSYHPQDQSGKFSSVNVRYGEEATGESYEERSVSYKVNDRTATVSIKKTLPRSNFFPTEKFIISITDSDKVNPLTSWRVMPYRFEMMIEKTYGEELLKVSYAKHWFVLNNDIFWMVAPLSNKIGAKSPILKLYNQDATKNAKITTNPGGGITETSINPYRVRGCDNRRGLVVIEWKKKGWDQNPYMVTVSHYFASLHNSNTGFSVLATITGEENGFIVENPIAHPATSLFEMFDKVSRTGHWTPNACPHCANENTCGFSPTVTSDPPRQRSFTMFQSNSKWFRDRP
ncbi:hypothetical protein VNO77_44573 [Canavalia gladiata]|uniref:Uncharacterized protein n=1 Tax=Canavalia gladiata TaxID=3824 RepID=A0AAN9JZ73_CANGL